MPRHATAHTQESWHTEEKQNANNNIYFSFTFNFNFVHLWTRFPNPKTNFRRRNTFSKSESEYWRSAFDSLALSDNYENDINHSEMSERTKKAIDSLEMFFGPLTQTVACSWYCGGGPYKISSSSVLNDNPNYSDQNIHDFGLLTAWVPKTKNGIGESINFHFKAKSPRINAVIIYNGYIKTNELWKNNSRAQKSKIKN